MRLKNIFMATIIVFLMIFLGACNDDQSSSESASYEITLAAAVQTDTAMYKAAEEFKETVEDKTDGEVHVDLVFGGILGGDREMIDSHQRGEIEMVFATDIAYGILVEEIGFVNLPFLFPDYSTVDEHYFNGFLGEKVKELLLEEDMRVLGWAENDYRSLTSNHPIETIDDLAGMKIRVPEFPSLMTFFQDLGANPTPMAFTEVLTGLQQNTIDGQDNGPILTESSGFYEVQDYFTWTNHVYSGGALSINEAFFQDLPEELQNIILEEGEQAGMHQVEWNRENVANSVDIMEEAGVIISEITPEVQAEFESIASEVWEEYSDDYDPEVMDYISSELAN